MVERLTPLALRRSKLGGLAADFGAVSQVAFGVRHLSVVFETDKYSGELDAADRTILFQSCDSILRLQVEAI